MRDVAQDARAIGDGVDLVAHELDQLDGHFSIHGIVLGHENAACFVTATLPQVFSGNDGLRLGMPIVGISGEDGRHGLDEIDAIHGL